MDGFYIPRAHEVHAQRLRREGLSSGRLLAVICNDLREAVGRADSENLRNLPAFVDYFYNEAPAQCWGSEAKLDAWVTKFAAEREATT